MKSFTIVALSLVTTSLLFISGCANYQAKPLARLVIPANPHNKEQKVTLSYRVFSKRDCQHYLDRDVIAKGYQPVHITICNNTNRVYNLCLDNFSIPCIDNQIVAEKVHTSTVKRAASYGVGALFFFPLIIPAVVDGVGSSQANQQLDADFEHKALANQIINPFTTVNGLIFVPTKDFTHNFTIALADVSNNERVVLASNDFCIKA